MKIRILLFTIVLFFFSSVAVSGQVNVRFRRGETNRPYSGSVGKAPKVYRVRLLRGSVLFLQARGNVNYQVRAAGQSSYVGVEAGGEFVSSRHYDLENQTNYLIKVFSASGRREKFTLFV